MLLTLAVVQWPLGRAFSLMDNNFNGFDFWLSKLNSFSTGGEDMRNPQAAENRVLRAEMVRAFITSMEYQSRVGP